MNEQERELHILTQAAIKAVIVIGLVVLIGMLIVQSKLDASTVADCNDACQTSSTQMESVTVYKCICKSIESRRSPWVLN
tara:strand:+ start:40 stop:279 length:240 start_codon:yes stop_codon:yes gene_type:complete